MINKKNQSGIHVSEVAHLLDADLYGYGVDESLIAHEPAVPRDSSRLLVFDTRTGSIQIDSFRNCARYIPERSLLVMNDTKVVPARVRMTKTTGGITDILFLVNEWKQGSAVIQGLVPRGMRVGTVLYRDLFGVKVLSHNEHIFTFELLFPPEKLFDFLNRFGVMPLPGYIQSSLTEADVRERYQSLQARVEASVAAPTASLHFTEAVFEDLAAKGVNRASVTLHVGLGTFEPLNEKHIESKKLHSEYFDVPPSTAHALRGARKDGRTIVAVGTTVLRALESARHMDDGGAGVTDVFIQPPYHFDSADVLLTNFHVPYSSLMMLVEAFMQHKNSPLHLVDIYKRAIAERMRFFSFGDAMLIV